ncbi:unnamed protein product [Leptidea sinapis]|uniref:Uncharacterized protein n=1 Tax=Leptidea sinapis TaxID=189913 RepID=A0A5E4QUN7_9NEOP|nr:unnamed protein product [Leptidea sinapis]
MFVLKYNMELRLIFLIFFMLAVFTSALPAESGSQPMKRDLAESVKDAWNGAVKTVSDAGDAVVDAVKPTEKSVIDKMASGLKDIVE